MTSAEARHVSLLRGINVSGSTKVPMAWLRDAYEAAGCRDVATYLRSGNVVFRRDKPEQVGDEVAAAIRADLGLEIALVDRTHDDLVRIVADDPFPDADPSKRVVVFLSDELSEAKIDDLRSLTVPGEALEVRPRELHLHCPHGLGRSKLSAAVAKKDVQVVATARNWRTVLALLDLSAPEAG